MTGAPDPSLDGEYTLVEEDHQGVKREEICLDECVYRRNNMEYCFKFETQAESTQVAEASCEVTFVVLKIFYF